MDRLQVGAITSTHGLKGEVKVFPTTDDPKRFNHLKEVIVALKQEDKILEIENVKFFKKLVILKFKGIDRIEDIERYVGNSLFITRDKAVPLKKDEYFVVDLIGLKVINENGEHIGLLKDILFTGANDVYVVETEGKDLLLPAIKECILEVSPDEGHIKVHVMEGLMDL